MNFLKIKKSICLCSLLSFFSCGKGGEAPKLGAEQEAQNREPVETRESLKDCSKQKVVEILEDGNLIVSRMKNEEDRLFVWDKNSKEEKTSIFFPGTYHKVAPNGEYLLNNLSFRRFQFMLFEKGTVPQTLPLSFYSADNPDVKFTNDSKWLVIRYKPVTSPDIDTISFFDIEKRNFLRNFNFENVRHVEVSSDKKFIYLGIEKGRHKKIVKYDYESGLVIFEKGFYSRGYFSKFTLLDNVLMTIDNGEYVFYDTETSNILYKKNFRYVYDSDTTGNYLLVATDWNELGILDVKTGVVSYKEKRLERVYASSCQVRSSETIICQDSSEVGKVIEWNMKTNLVTESCF